MMKAPAEKGSDLVGLILIIFLTLFISCSSGGGGDDGSKGQETLYYVGGYVNGLSGTLVLQNNGGDDLSIASDGLFEFDTPLPDRANYSVTLLNSPIDQNCTIADESGAINGTDIADIEVTCENKTWSHPGNLSDNISPDGQDADPPKVAMDDNGNAIITWEQSDGSHNQIFKSEYRNGVWSHPGNLSDNISPDGQDADSPQVAMDDNGNAIITWYQSDGSKYQIFKSEYRNGAWTHPISLSDNISPDGQDAYFPQVAMDNNDQAIIIWRQSDGSKYQIFKSEYRFGAWNHPDSLSDNISPDGQDADSPQVAMDDNGNAIITWAQYGQIFKSEYRTVGWTWTHPGTLSDNISPDGQNAWNPQVAMDNNGNGIITWFQMDGSGFLQIFLSEYRNGAWTHPSDTSDFIGPDGGVGICNPRVAMDNNGQAIITWRQSGFSYDGIFMSEFRSGAWNHPSGTNDSISPDGTSSNFPQVAMEENGNAIIIWFQSDGGNYQIFKSDYR